MSSVEDHKLRKLGSWWLPSNREKKVPGILTYSPDDEGQLELTEILSEASGTHDVENSSDSKRAGDYGRICGEVGGEPFTLEGCFMNGSSSHNDGIPEKIYVNRIIQGMELELDQPVEATAVEVRLLHLPYWISEDGIIRDGYSLEETSEGKKNFECKVSLLPDHTIKLNNGMTLNFKEKLSIYSDGVNGISLNRDIIVNVNGELTDLQRYIKLVSAFQLLVSMGIGRTATLEKFLFYHPDVTLSGNDSQFSAPINLFIPWYNWESREPDGLKLNDFLFNLTDLGGNPVVNRWCDFALDHYETISTVMATRYRPNTFFMDKFFNRAAALEALDRDTHDQDELRFRCRMERLVDLAGDGFAKAVGGVHKWAEQITEARNDVAHHTDRSPGKDVRFSYYLSESAYYLFVICVLRHVEAEEAAFASILRNPKFLHTSQEVSRHLG